MTGNIKLSVEDGEPQNLAWGGVVINFIHVLRYVHMLEID